MSAITSANVTWDSNYGWEIGDRFGKKKAIKKFLAITLSAQGGTAGDIPASALGMGMIYEAYACELDNSGTKSYPKVGVASDFSEIVPTDMTNSTDATRADRANLTGILYCWVTGTEA